MIAKSEGPAESSTTPSATPFADLDDYLELGWVQGLALSGDGRRLVVGVNTPDHQKNRFRTTLWAVDPEGTRPARRLTRSVEGESAAAFTPSGDLLFVSARPAPGADEEPTPALWLLPAEGGDARVLAAPAGGVRGVRVARESGRVVFGSALLPSAADLAQDAEIRAARRDAGVGAILHERFPVRYWDHDLGPDRTRLFTTELPDGGNTDGGNDGESMPRDLTGHVGPALDDDSSWDVSSDGRTVVVSWMVGEPGGSTRFTAVAIDTADGTRRVLADDPDNDHESPRISPDGRRVAIAVQRRISPEDPGDRWILVLPIDGGGAGNGNGCGAGNGGSGGGSSGDGSHGDGGSADSGSSGNYGGDGDSSDGDSSSGVGDRGNGGDGGSGERGNGGNSGGEVVLGKEWDRWPRLFGWMPDGRALIVGADDNGRAPLWRVDVATGARTKLTGDDGAYSDVHISPDGNWIYAIRTAVDSPPTPVRLPADGTAPAQPLRGPVPAPALPGRLTEVTATAEDGTPLRAWLSLPHQASAENPVPLLLQIHGGPVMSANAWSWRWNPWLFVARGYAVLQPDPALSTGYGREFIERGWGSWGAKPFTDLMTITDAAQQRAEIDADTSAALGASFGGYMANWVAGHTDRFDAIVSHASVWNLWQSNQTGDAANYFSREMPLDVAEANSPHHAVDAIRTPMLIIHGDRDYRVSVTEAMTLWWDLSARSKSPDGSSPHKFLYFPDENHWILRPHNVKIWYETVLAFLAHHLRGADWQPPTLLG